MREALYQPFPMLPGRRAQLWQHQPSFLRPRHFHEEPEFNLVLGGHARFAIGRRLVAATRGTLLYFHPGQDHVLLEASSDLELFVLAVRPELLFRFSAGNRVRLLPLDVSAPGTRSLDEAETTRVHALLSALRDLTNDEASERRLVELFSTFHRQVPLAPVTSRRTLELLSLDLSSPEALIADALGTPQSELSRRFHADFGAKFVEVRSRLRLMRFIRFVDEGEGLLRAALRADFGSYAQLHRTFRRLFACSPQEYFSGGRLIVDAATQSDEPREFSAEAKLP